MDKVYIHDYFFPFHINVQDHIQYCMLGKMRGYDTKKDVLFVA